MGSLIEYVAAHEVGHTLGFQHNMKASSMYPQEKVRDREWVKKMRCLMWGWMGTLNAVPCGRG